MMTYADILMQNGQEDLVREKLWNDNGNGGIIKFDMDYVTNSYAAESCDLWEEIRAKDLFWNQMSYHFTLTHAIKFANKMGDSAAAQSYQATLDKLAPLIEAHWNGEFL